MDAILTLMFESNTERSIVQGIYVLQSLIEYKRHNANLNQPPPEPHHPGRESSANLDPDASDFEGIPQRIVQSQSFEANMDPGSLSSADSVSALDALRLAQSVRQVHAAVHPRLSQFHEFLSNKPPIRPIATTIGIIERPLGAARIEVVHFIRALLSSNNPAINRALAAHRTLSVLIVSTRLTKSFHVILTSHYYFLIPQQDLFFDYPWNSFLHTQVEQSVRLIFFNSKATSPVTSPTEEEASDARKSDDKASREAAVLLVRELIQDTRLMTVIPQIWSRFNQKEEGSDREIPVLIEHRPGFMGHLIKIANYINDAVSSDDNVKEFLDSLPPETREAWDSFVDSSLPALNTRMKTPLVPDVPSSGFEEATHRAETALHQAFFQYQMQQMTKNLCSEIGFNTSDFAAPEGSSLA